MVVSDFFLPKEAFLTECKHTEIFAITPSIKTNNTYNHTALHPISDASLGRKASITPTLHSIKDASLTGCRKLGILHFLPKEAFLTECKQRNSYEIKAALPSTEELQNELPNF